MLMLKSTTLGINPSPTLIAKLWIILNYTLIGLNPESCETTKFLIRSDWPVTNNEYAPMGRIFYSFQILRLWSKNHA